MLMIGETRHLVSNASVTHRVRECRGMDRVPVEGLEGNPNGVVMGLSARSWNLREGSAEEFFSDDFVKVTLDRGSLTVVESAATHEAKIVGGPRADTESAS